MEGYEYFLAEAGREKTLGFYGIIDKMSRIVGMNLHHKGYDPVRHGRFVAGDYVDTNGRDIVKKDAVLLGYTTSSIIVQQFNICPYGSL